MNIQDIPNEFIIKTNYIYPPFNTKIFEEYFYEYYINNNTHTERTYLPILWTSFYIGRNFGNNDMSDLQNFINSLDKNKKYFTVLQYDDGILQDISNIDIKVFCSGGGGQKIVSDKNLGYPIPLICNPNPNINKNRYRDILCSFVGAIDGRHRIREKMRAKLINIPNYIIKNSEKYDSFTNIMERSIFSLCPRGYGATSFRICESLQHGSIPIYIYDKDWTPWPDEFDFEEIGIKIHESEIDNIPEILSKINDEDILKMKKNGNIIYNEYFSYNGCSKKILENLKNENIQKREI